MTPSTMSMCALGLWLALQVQGCAGAAEPPPVSHAQRAAADEYLSLDEATAFCVHLHEELVTCAPEFIDLLLELRARYDVGFAAEHATPEAIAEAKRVGIEEVKEDGSGPLAPRQERCRGYARAPKTPRSAPPELEACFAISECTQKIACTRPVMEARFRTRAQAAAGASPAPTREPSSCAEACKEK
jgi:hypothetical protein